jgi:beta-glucanase (GH16 family)
MKKYISIAINLLFIAAILVSCNKDTIDSIQPTEYSNELTSVSLVDSTTPTNSQPLIIGDQLKSTPAGDWELMFSDEFTDTTIDDTKWNNIYYDRGWKDGIQTFWRPINVSENGNSMVLRFQKDWNNAYSSGRLDTEGLFEMAYGYWECRMHVVYPDGYQAAFWMMPSGGILPGGVADGTANDGAEIDILEARKQTDEFATNLHWDGYGAAHMSSHKDVSATGIHNNWMNVFGLEWTPTYMKFYYNGELKRTITLAHQIAQVKEFAILSGGVFAGNWVDGDIFTASLPDWAYVDYIRVYKNKQMDYGTGYYKIVNALSGKALSVEDWITKNGAKVVQLTDNEYTNQKFQIEHLGNGLYKVIAEHSSKCIAKAANNDYLTQQTFKGGDHQKWLLQPVAGTNLTLLQNYSDQKYAEVEAGSVDNNARIITESNPTLSKAQWEIIWVEN